MRFVMSLFIVLAMAVSVQAGTVVLSEDFEGASPGTTVSGYNGWSGDSILTISGTIIDVGQSAVGAAGSWGECVKPITASNVGSYELTATLVSGNGAEDYGAEVTLSYEGAFKGLRGYVIGAESKMIFGQTDSNGDWIWLAHLVGQYSANTLMDVKLIASATGSEAYYREHGTETWTYASPTSGSTVFENDLTSFGYVDLRGYGIGNIDSVQLVANAVPEPSSVVLLACGLVSVLAGVCRKRR